MTFDEVIKGLRGNRLSDEITIGDTIKIIKTLKDQYAPTVEMTKTQYSFITSEYEQKNVVDAVANLTVDNILKENFHQSFWKPLTQNEVVQAWLHPETIKIVDE